MTVNRWPIENGHAFTFYISPVSVFSNLQSRKEGFSFAKHLTASPLAKIANLAVNAKAVLSFMLSLKKNNLSTPLLVSPQNLWR